jgi:2-methylcitrate dehydratase PrpD
VREFDEHYADADVARFRDTVSMTLDAEVDNAYPSRWIGKVTVTTRDGRRIEGRVEEPKGDPGNTLSRAELEHKVRSLGLYAEAATAEEIARAIKAIWAMTNARILSPLLPSRIAELHHA